MHSLFWLTSFTHSRVFLKNKIDLIFLVDGGLADANKVLASNIEMLRK